MRVSLAVYRKAIWLDAAALNEAVITFTHDHYLRERPHQSLGNQPPQPPPNEPAPDSSRPIIRHDRLGGLIHVYRRAA